MSASSKKKLRNENTSAKMTERQIAEQKEAKKLKIYTIAFVAVLIVMIAVAVYTGIANYIASSGIHEKNTIAATVGDHEISNAELSYYYMDALNNFNSTYGDYAYLYGIDTSTALDQQVIDEETGETWADSFIEQAVSSAQAVYALVDAAKAEGFTLPEEQQQQLELTAGNLDAYASIYGYANADAFIKAQYGSGTSKQSYLDYYERNLIASAYQTAHQDALTYTDDQIREADSANAAIYSSYSYNQYYVAPSKFLTGGTTDEDGNTTYSDAENAAALQAAEEAANALVNEEITSVEELDAAIAAMPVNEGTDASSTAYNDQRYSSINTYLTEWVTDSSRQEGDKAVIPVSTTSTDEDGNETETVTAYYVVFFRGENKNETKLVNVRHILVSFDGETNEDGTYTDEAKAAAKESAESILDEWKNGDATEDSFAALANERSTDTGSNTNGGLYEDIYPGQMVTEFNDWCFDASRTAGDTGIVETTYGYHVMYFSGTADQTYRDYLITNDLVSADMETWYNALLESYTVVNGDTSYMKKDIVLAK